MEPASTTHRTERRLPSVVVVSTRPALAISCRNAVEPYPVVVFESAARALEELVDLKPVVVVIDDADDDDRDFPRLREVVIAVGARLLRVSGWEDVIEPLRDVLREI